MQLQLRNIWLAVRHLSALGSRYREYINVKQRQLMLLWIKILLFLKLTYITSPPIHFFFLQRDQFLRIFAPKFLRLPSQYHLYSAHNRLVNCADVVTFSSSALLHYVVSCCVCHKSWYLPKYMVLIWLVVPCILVLTLIVLMWRIGWAHNNARK